MLQIVFQVSHAIVVFIFANFYCSISLAAADPGISSEAQALAYWQKYGYMAKSISSPTPLLTGNTFSTVNRSFQNFSGLPETGELDVKQTWMTSYSKVYQSNLRLDQDDVKAIKAMYGRSSKDSPGPPPIPGPKPLPPPNCNVPDLCHDSTFDAATKTADGSIYFFKGNYYWRYSKDEIDEGYPRTISRDWGGLPGNLDAVLSWNDGSTYFFKEDQYWRFSNNTMDSGYPKDISDGFERVPGSIDAAFVWKENGKTYFFKGDNYWRYDIRTNPPVSYEYPQPISFGWEGIPNNIDAVIPWTDHDSYFFKGREYLVFNDMTYLDDPPFPSLASVELFDC